MIFPSNDHCIPCPPLTNAMPITAPIIACELETGTSGNVGQLFDNKIASNPCDAKINKTTEWYDSQFCETCVNYLLEQSWKLFKDSVFLHAISSMEFLYS